MKNQILKYLKENKEQIISYLIAIITSVITIKNNTEFDYRELMTTSFYSKNFLNIILLLVVTYKIRIDYKNKIDLKELDILKLRDLNNEGKIEILKNILNKNLENLIHVFYELKKFNSNYRITIYKKIDNHLYNLSRGSHNPIYKDNGRPKIKYNEDLIGCYLASNKSNSNESIIFNFPEYSTNKSEYFDELRKTYLKYDVQFNINKIKKIKMKSDSLFISKLVEKENSIPNIVGVIVIESVKGNIKLESIEKDLEEFSKLIQTQIKDVFDDQIISNEDIKSSLDTLEKIDMEVKNG